MKGVVVAVLVLALGVGSARADAAPIEGRWAGESSAGLPVYFEVASNRVVDVRFTFRWGFCGTFESHHPEANLEIDPAGHWVLEDSRGQTLEGTFVAPDRVEGKIVSVERQTPGCPRTEATFAAAPVPPNPESLEAARKGIDALPFEIRLRTPRGVGSVLIGKVRGNFDETFRFFLFVNRPAAKRLPGVPGYEVRGPGGNIHPGLEGGRLANTDFMLATLPGAGYTKNQKRDRRRILALVAHTICLRQTGKSCAEQGPSPWRDSRRSAFFP